MEKSIEKTINNQKELIKIPVIYNFARSGGTLINRCLGSIEGNVVLSEINPLASVNPIENQARDWFKLISSEEFQEFSELKYSDKIIFLLQKTIKNGQKLIIRDWTTINFIPNVTTLYSVNSTYALEQEIHLNKASIDSIPIVIVRRSADIFDSIKRTFKYLDNFSIKEFGNNYLCYAKAISSYPIFHYENFCKAPEIELKKICDTLAVHYDVHFINQFSKYQSCTGDVAFLDSSRGAKLDKIEILQSFTKSDNYLLAMVDQNCNEADRLLGYKNMEIEKERIFWQLIDYRDKNIESAKKNNHEIETKIEKLQSQLESTQSQLENTQSQLEQSEQIIATMERSKFWKIQQIWLKFKKLLQI